MNALLSQVNEITRYSVFPLLMASCSFVHELLKHSGQG
jgi:hypothetical protein